MHNFIRRSSFVRSWALAVIVSGMLGGCGSSTGTKPATGATHADKIAETKVFVMQAGGVDVLKLTTSPDAQCVVADGALHFNRQHPYEVEFWLVSDAKSVDEVVPHVATQIVSEFEDFKPDQTTELMIAGSPAKRLRGSGHEADDHDPGAADVIVFKVGGHIFVACNHGESLDPPTQQRMLEMVQTAQKP